jgi:hypothetical protein
LGAEGRPFSGAVVADDGYDLVHARFATPIALAAGLAAAAREVANAGRTVQAIAGFELRIPEPLSHAEFDSFNRDYVAQLKGMGLEVNRMMPATRTNVAATVGGVSEPSVYAVSYTVPTVRSARAFVLSGAPEEKSGDAATMLESIMRVLTRTLDEIGASWSEATAIQLYGIDDFQKDLVEKVLSRTGSAAIHGIHWFPSRPPIVGLKLEIDARSAGLEVVVKA